VRAQSVSDRFLASLVAEFADETVHAIALSGSFARGDATDQSDVDLVLYARTLPDGRRDRERLGYREGRLVSVDVQSIEDRLADLRRPADAIVAVLALRRLRTLRDRDGELAALKEAARRFAWEPLQPAADAYAGFTLERLAEVVHKLLAALAAGDPAWAAPYAWELATDLAHAVATQRGVLIDSGRTYLRQIHDAVGPESPWTSVHRRAAGLVPIPAGDPPALAAATAALALYRETAALLAPVLAPEDRAVVAEAVRRIAAQGG
jgi:predicted nucleotidyltransferase